MPPLQELPQARNARLTRPAGIRKGKALKSLQELKLPPFKPIQHMEGTYSHQKKMEVLLFCCGTACQSSPSTRPP